MGSKAVLGVIVLAAVAGIFFLLGGTDLFSGSSGDAGDGASGTAGDLTVLDGGADADAANDETGSKGPVLFGSARAGRKGLGGLEGHVMDFESGKSIEGAQATLTGEGYGGKPVTAQARSDASGFFSFSGVAAGDGYSLHVSDAQGRQRTLPSQSVDRGGVTDVGKVWLGKRGTLRGRVVDGTGHGVAGADVQVHPGGSSMLELLSNMGKLLEQLDKDAEPLARTETDASGRFEITEVAPGPLTLVVRSAGHEQATQSIIMAHEGAAGGDVEVQLLPADAITGIVVDGRDRPVAQARVACLDKSEMQSIFYGRQFSETDAQGRFTIPSPPSRGGFAVIVTATGYPTLFAEAKGRGEQRFVLQGGTEVTLRVVEAGTSRGVADAHLMAMFSGESGLQSKEGMSFTSGTTDGRGEVTLLARPGQLAMLYFNHAERGTAIYSPIINNMTGLEGKSMLTGPKEATVGSSRTTFEFQLGAGITVTGHVTDDQGKPLEGVRCAAMGMMGLGGSVWSDAEGYFELKRQSPPVRFLVASKSGYVQELNLASMAGVRKVKEEGVIDITMLRAASVTGRVVTEEGKPVAGARVRAAIDGAMAMLSALTEGSKESITNAEGRYVIQGVQPGKEVRVKARHANFLDSQTAEFKVAPAGATLAPDLVVEQGAVLQVTVEFPDGRAARGVQVGIDVDADEEVVFDPMRRFQSFADVVTGAGGKVELPQVPIGSVTLTAKLEGYAPGRVVYLIGVVPADRVEIVVPLRRGMSVRGQVVDQQGVPLEGASVRVQGVGNENEVRDEDWVPMDLAVAGKDGRFELKGLPGLPVELTVSVEGYVAAKRRATPGLGSLTIELQKQAGDAAARLEAIKIELKEISLAFAKAKGDDERTVLAQRMQALYAERVKLEGE